MHFITVKFSTVEIREIWPESSTNLPHGCLWSEQLNTITCQQSVFNHKTQF